jgi:hypothetical protein
MSDELRLDPSLRRITPEELDEMSEAFLSTYNWRQLRTGVYSGNGRGWLFLVFQETIGAEWTAQAYHEDRQLEVRLGPTVAEVWHRMIAMRAN